MSKATEKREKHFNLIKEELKRYLKNDNIKWEDASKTDKGDAFSKYFVKEQLSRSFNLDEDEIENGLAVGGKGDLGIDFVYELEDAFIITQAKWRETTTIKDNDLLEFVDLYTEKLYKSENVERGNDRVKEYLVSVRQKKKIKPIFLDFVYSRPFSRNQRKSDKKRVAS